MSLVNDPGIKSVRAVYPRPTPGAKRALVCLGFCGGGSGPYHPWAEELDADTELILVVYPGREGRFAEPCARSWDELALDTAATVAAVATVPYVLFGHSMGGWMAFDVATRFERRGGPVPTALVVSSCNAPGRGASERDKVPRLDDPDPALLDWMRSGGLLPSFVFDEPDLRDMAVDLMRADIRVRDSYLPRPDARTGIPLHVLHGQDDKTIDPETAHRWRQVAAGTCVVESLVGGHFYTPETWRGLPGFFGPPRPA